MTASGAGRRSILRNAAHLFGSHLATTLARGIYVVIVARVLGPEQFGVFNYALAWYLLFISLTYLGLDTYLMQRVGTEPASAPVALRETLIIRAVAAVLAAVIAVAIAWGLDTDPEVRRLSAIFALALVGRALWLWAVSAFTAFERTHFALRWDAVFRPLEILVALAMLAYTPQLHWLAATHALLWCAQGAVGLGTVVRRLAPFAGPVEPRRLLQLLSRTLPAGIYAIVVSAFTQAPIVLVKSFESDPVQVGQFVLAFQICVYLLIVPYLFSTTMLPVVSRSVARGDGQDVLWVDLLVRIVCVGGAATLVVLGPAVPFVSDALFGKQYHEAGQLLQSGLWLAIPFAAVTFLQQLFFARGAYTSIGVCGALGAMVMVAAMFPAMSYAPRAGALLAAGAGMAAWLVLTLWWARSYVLTRRPLRSASAFAAAVIAFAVHTLSAQLGALVQALLSLAALTVATFLLGAIRRDDLRLVMRAKQGL